MNIEETYGADQQNSDAASIPNVMNENLSVAADQADAVDADAFMGDAESVDSLGESENTWQNTIPIFTETKEVNTVVTGVTFEDKEYQQPEQTEEEKISEVVNAGPISLISEMEYDSNEEEVVPEQVQQAPEEISEPLENIYPDILTDSVVDENGNGVFHDANEDTYGLV